MSRGRCVQEFTILSEENKKVFLKLKNESETGLLWDMHTHLQCLTKKPDLQSELFQMIKSGEEELNYRRSQHTAAFFSCGTPGEWEEMQKIVAASDCDHSGKERIHRDLWHISFGIHPWYSDQYEPEDYLEYFKCCDAVGEIGMDNVWCDVPLRRQRKVLEQQLQIAADYQKAIVLHTKGQEGEIADIIQDFPGHILVHWYSGDGRTLERFLEKGCYFTLGPDLGWNIQNELYQHMIKNIPVQRLFLETDGLDAVLWALDEWKNQSHEIIDPVGKEEKMKWELLENVLWRNLCILAEHKRKKPEEILRHMMQNLSDFLMK